MILITGGEGQLGCCLKQALKQYGREVVAPGKEQMDITDPEATARFFSEYHPDIVVHCAAYSQVDLAEEDTETCWKANVYGTQVIAELCRTYGSYLLYISTDYVFDGMKTEAYEIFDTKNPLSVYGKTKSKGEDIVLNTVPGGAVLRTSWLFGHSENNFVEAILRNASKNPTLRVVCDQVGSPTYTEDLVELIKQMLEKRCAGIYHGTSEGICSWAQFARQILLETGVEAQINEVSSQMYGAKATRPSNSILSKKSLDDAGLSRLPHWEDALKRYLAKQERMKQCL